MLDPTQILNILEYEISNFEATKTPSKEKNLEFRTSFVARNKVKPRPKSGKIEPSTHKLGSTQHYNSYRTQFLQYNIGTKYCCRD